MHQQHFLNINILFCVSYGTKKSLQKFPNGLRPAITNTIKISYLHCCVLLLLYKYMEGFFDKIKSNIFLL